VLFIFRILRSFVLQRDGRQLHWHDKHRSQRKTMSALVYGNHRDDDVTQISLPVR